MADPFIAEIRMMGFAFAPSGWARCEGQILPINQNQALFSLLGTRYGGNGQITFALPDLRDRVPVHAGPGVGVGGSRGGQAEHTLTISELPQHTHVMTASASNADVTSPAGNVLAQTSQSYGPAATLTALEASTNGVTGGSQPHTNLQPYLSINYCIALQGVFPSLP